jgi:hypothetical protein
MTNKKTVLGALVALLMAGTASAANIPVTANITTSTTWTANNVYNLVGQIYVMPGATLTIDPGTVVKSNPVDLGSLAVTRGAKIFVNGTATQPVVMTSTLDNMTTWREGANEWGNLTILGNGLISASEAAGAPLVVLGRTNTAVPDGLNQKQMEGLTASSPTDTKGLYGGNNDNDDSGSIHYLSLRYGGKVIGLGNELNGLSMGAIGRATDVDHVEVMNNVDDCVETWGGAVNYKYLNLWNCGDDGFDVDEGWRGKAQFGLIVQGYSVDAARGSGVSDNMFEIDGAEDSDAQPITTATIYNFTGIGQPVSARGATAWRDNAHVQYRNSIFMDAGQQLVRFDNLDGDGAHGYGFNGTLSWAATWTTPFTFTSPINAGSFAAGAFNDPAVMYKAQTSGNLAEISDSVFFQNVNAAAYTESDARGVTVTGGSNPVLHNVVASASPIKAITRGPAVTKGTLTVLPVVSLDPRANNDAVSSFATAPADGFFTQAPYRGAFSATNNWLKGWTAADTYGMTVTTGNEANPSSTIKLTASTTFQTVVGVVYTVESSPDGVNWSPVKTIVGDGTLFSVTDLADFDNAKLYRAIAQ